MGTIAEKLSYLNTTKSKIRDSINLTGANLTSEDTFRSYASKLKKGYIDIINNGIDTLYNNFPKVSGIGSNLSLTPTYEAPMKLNEIQGDTLQDGTPTPDTPVEIQSVTGNQEIKVTGKNLVSFNDLQTSNNTSYTWQNDILQVSATTGTYNRAYKDITDLYKNNPSKKLRFDFTSYDFSQGNDAKIQLQIVSNGITSYETLVETSGTINTRTIPNDTSSITQVLLRLVSNNTSTSQASMISLTEPILHFGETTTTYEPYKGNTYEVNLGKNLFDKDNITTGKRLYYWQGTAELIDDTNYCVSDYINVNANSTYTINLTMSAFTRMIFFDNNKNPLSFNETNATFTTPNNTAYVRLSVPLNQLDTTQLEKGSQPTSFSPYFTPIELNKIGDYKDSIKKSTGKNLLDLSKCINGYINSSGGIGESNYDLLSDYIKVESGKNYTISLNTQFYNIGYAFYDSSKTYILRYNTNRNLTTLTTTIPSGTSYIRIWFNYNGTTTLTPANILTYQPMINEGSTALPYEPYGKVWYVEKQTRRLELAIENMNNNENYPGWIAYDEIKQLRKDVYNGIIANGLEFYTNYYTNIAKNNSWVSVNFNSANEPTLYLSRGYWGQDHTQTYWKTNYPNLIVTLIYGLQTPEITEITNTELIEDLETLYTAKSQEGTTNISITSEDLEMILNVSALKGDVE